MNYEKFTVSVGKFNLTNIGECEIIVKSHEDKIKPRFYIIDSNGKEVCAICMFKTKYIYGKKLDEIQRKELQKFLDSDTKFIKSDAEYIPMRYKLFELWNASRDTAREYKYKDIEKLDFNNLPDC